MLILLRTFLLKSLVILKNILFDANSIFSRILLSVLYIIIYDYIFEDFIVFFFSYIGIEYIARTPLATCIWIVLSVIPFLFYTGFKCISSLITLFLYLFAYIPIVHALFITYGISVSSAVIYSFVLCIIFIAYFTISPKYCIFKQLEMHPKIPLRTIEIITLIFSIVLIGARASSMHFVNILTERDVLYELRAENFKEAQSMAILLYLQGWLGCTFYPILLVIYLKKKAWIKTMLVIAGNFFLFMIDMQKITFIIPFLMIFLFYYLKNRGDGVSKYLHSVLMFSIIIIGLILIIGKDDEIMLAIGAIVLLRTVCVAGWLSEFYFHFFAENPFTYYSHINIVNAITNSYPYDQPLGYAVAYGGQNANANFLLTDGYAAAGLAGIILIGIIFYVLLHFINAISSRYQTIYIFVVLIPMISSILNVSLFTTLLTKGFFLLMIIMMCTDNPLIKEEPKTKDKQKTKEDEALHNI